MLKVAPKDGAVFNGTMSPEFSYYRLATIKGALTLESKGMTSRQGPLRPKLATEFGLKPRAPFEDYINVAQTKMAAILEANKANQKETA